MVLPFRTRLRVAARLGLSRGLRAVPAPLATRVHDAYTGSTGRRRALLEPVASVLRHRPLAPLREFSLPGNPELRLVAVESRLARLLYWYGGQGYEGAEAEWWRRLCARSSAIVELGANIGYYTVQGASAAPAAKYTTVEANPESAEIVRRNLALNGLEHVTVVAAAVVGEGEPATAELAFPDEERYAAPTGAYLHARAEGMSHRPAARTVTVPAVQAAEVIGDADLIKLDIEGYEAHVLDAVRTRIAATRPTIVVEILRTATRLREIVRELHHEGYLAFAIGTDSLHLLTAEQLRAPRPLPRHGSRDVILVPRERATDL